MYSTSKNNNINNFRVECNIDLTDALDSLYLKANIQRKSMKNLIATDMSLAWHLLLAMPPWFVAVLINSKRKIA